MSPPTVFAPEAFDDLADAARAASAEDPTDVVFVGLCTGAYEGLESARALAPRGVIALNPALVFDPPEAAAGPVDPRRALGRPAGAAVRGFRCIPSPRLRRWIRAAAWRTSGVPSPARSPWPVLRELAGRAVAVLVVVGDDDAWLAAAPRERSSGASSDPTVRVEHLAGLEHALVSLRARQEVSGLLGAFVTECFCGSDRSPAGPGRPAVTRGPTRPVPAGRVVVP